MRRSIADAFLALRHCSMSCHAELSTQDIMVVTEGMDNRGIKGTSFCAGLEGYHREDLQQAAQA